MVLHTMKEVDAVKTIEEVLLVERLLRTHHGDLYGDIWRIGVNLSLRISDLLAIRFADLDLENHLYTLVEGKTGKTRQIRLNPTALSLIENRKAQYPDDVFLFQPHSNRTASLVKSVSRVTVAKMFKIIGDRIGLHISTHSLRKTRGWAMHSSGARIEVIAKVLNHTSTSTTMSYLGISKADILNTYLEYEL